MSDPRSELELFVTEVERLLHRSFFARFQEQDICFSDIVVQDNSPSIEQLESFVLHFRKFLQQNDRVAISRVRAHFEAFTPPQEIKEQWQHLHATFDEMCNSKAIANCDFSLRDIFRARTFGDLSHLDARHRKHHESLSATAEGEALYRFEYSTFLAETAELLEEMAHLCKQVLRVSA